MERPFDGATRRAQRVDRNQERRRVDAYLDWVEGPSKESWSNDSASDTLTEQTLLWAALGVHRPDTGGRTAPSAHNWQGMEVHDAFTTGCIAMSGAEHVLQLVAVGVSCALTVTQDRAATAPLDLVYIAGFSRMKDTDAPALARPNVVCSTVVCAPDELLATTEGARRAEELLAQIDDGDLHLR